MPRGGKREGAGRKPGVPNKAAGDIKIMAQQFGPGAISVLAELSGLLPGAVAESETARIAAIKELLDRAYGKATQPLSGDSSAPPVAIEFTWADAIPTAAQEATASHADDLAIVWADTIAEC